MKVADERIVVISLGGSLVVPKEGIDVEFLREFRALVYREIKNGKRFIIVVGGGRTARQYQDAANKLVSLADEDVDWIGIHATRLNGHLLRSVFRDVALHRVVKDPTKRLVWNRPVLIAAGWKPGWSTDYVAVRLAKRHGSNLVINLSNVDGVCDKDPRTNKDAVCLSRISWKAFRRMVGNTWNPGANVPFDPIASRFADQHGMTVAVAGRSMKNVARLLAGKSFEGTTIEG
jgi:uridylate kinase